MKKIIAATFVAMCSLSANAQIWVGGSVGFSKFDKEGQNGSFSKSNNTPTQLYFGPKVGYDFNDKWAVGLAFDYSSGDNKTTYDGSSSHGLEEINASSDEFLVTPFVRYTFAKSGIVSFYVDGGVSIGWGKEKDKRHYDDNNDNRDVHDSECRKTNSFDIGLRPGMLIDLSDNVALELNLGFLGYTHSEITCDTHNSNYENAEYTSTSNGFGFCGNGGNVNFGVIWKF